MLDGAARTGVVGIHERKVARLCLIEVLTEQLSNFQRRDVLLITPLLESVPEAQKTRLVEDTCAHDVLHEGLLMSGKWRKKKKEG